MLLHLRKTQNCDIINKKVVIMKKKPVLAIVGRPNVGKSTFFNKIAGKRISIVKNEPGVTRDRVIVDAEWLNYKFTMIDTGGLDLKSNDEIQQHIKYQAQLAIDVADVIIFMVDGKTGLAIGDMNIAKMLRKSNKPILLVVNKIDNVPADEIYEFYNLGLGEPYAISSEQAKGLGDLLDAVVKNFDIVDVEDEEKEPLKIAIVGRPNVGKSSITNRILGEERVVVSDQAGTTRDSIDTLFRWHGKDYILIDTAGLRKKNAISYETIEYYSVIRTIEAIKRADVVLIVLDANEAISEQDVKIAGIVHEEGKPSIVVYNKWDLVEKDNSTVKRYQNKLEEDLKFMSYFAPLFISAYNGQRLERIMPEVERVYANASRRLSTGVLNSILADAVQITPPPSQSGRRVKIKYITQASVNPPTFILFVNDENILHYSYLRFLENKLRDSADFSGTPIKIYLKSTKEN